MVFTIMEEDVSSKVTQSQAAKVLSPPICWESKTTKIGWQFKWSLNGIQPQRAIVMVVRDITIPDKHVFSLI